MQFYGEAIDRGTTRKRGPNQHRMNMFVLIWEKIKFLVLFQALDFLAKIAINTIVLIWTQNKICLVKSDIY